MKPHSSVLSSCSCLLRKACCFRSLCALFILGSSIVEASTPYARAGWKATLASYAHGVSGTVTIVDANTFRVDNFFYDGGGVQVHFIVAPSESDFYSANRIVTARNFLGSPFNGGSVTVDLPPGRTLDGQNAVSLWCIPFTSDFGSGTFAAPSTENIPPTLTLTTPAATTIRTVSTLTGDLQVKGTADDNVAVSMIQVQVNDGEWVDVPVVPAPTAAKPRLVSFDTTLPGALTNIYIASPASGANVVKVRAIDDEGNVSVERTSVVRMSVKVPLTVTVNGSSALRLITGASTTGYEIGRTYTLTARQFDSSILSDTSNAFSGWSGAGISGSALKLTFRMSADLASAPVITVTYVPMPFQRGKIGRFDGLVRTAPGSVVSNDTNGYFTATVAAGGTFTGSVAIAGRRHVITGIIANDGVAMFGTTVRSPTLIINRTAAKLPNLSLSFSVDLAGTTGLITGTLSDGTNTADISAQRAGYSVASPVPANYLNSTTRGFYTMVLPSKAQAVLTTEQFTQGDSVGSVSISPSGVVTGSVIMADGRVSTTAALFSTVLGKDGTFPLFGALYVSGTVTRGAISGLVRFDDTQPSTDLSGTDLRWFRPVAVAGSTLYPSGWPSGALVDLQGAKYAVVKGVSVLPNLPATASTAIANADITFSSGPLTTAIVKPFNLSTANLVKTATGAPSVTLTLTPATGAFTGKITPVGGRAMDYRGVILQKGAGAGGRGFFLGSTTVGAVTVFHK